MNATLERPVNPKHPYDRRTLEAALRALNRLRPKRLGASAYIASIPAGRMCAVGAFYVSEMTRGSDKRISPASIADQFACKWRDSIYDALRERGYHLDTIDAMEVVNSDPQNFAEELGMKRRRPDASDSRRDSYRYRVVRAWVEARLKQMEGEP